MSAAPRANRSTAVAAHKSSAQGTLMQTGVRRRSRAVGRRLVGAGGAGTRGPRRRSGLPERPPGPAPGRGRRPGEALRRPAPGGRRPPPGRRDGRAFRFGRLGGGGAFAAGTAAAGLLAGRRRLALFGGGHLRAEARHHVGPAALVGVQLQQAFLLGVLQQLAERAVAVVGLVERRLLALHRVLDHRRPEHLLVLAAQGQQRFQQQGERLALGLRQLRRRWPAPAAAPGRGLRSR